MTETVGLLLMAYGTPASLDDVEAYYTHIRRGRTPPPELLTELRGRYEAIGGVSPLNAITGDQGRMIEREMNRRAGDRVQFRLYTGMKHAPPFIADAVGKMAEDGIRRAVGMVLAPHYSTMSVGVYMQEARDAATAHGDLDIRFVREWHMQPDLLRALEDRLRGALERFDGREREGLVVVFSAHSLPERILSVGDPYPDQLLETSRELAARLNLARWQFGWQSAGRTQEPWLGPDILQVLDILAKQGVPAVLDCPVGFVADHLEVLYDLDIEAKQRASNLGIHFERTASLNADPRLAAALATAALEVFTP